jgi:Glutamate synthase central domain
MDSPATALMVWPLLGAAQLLLKSPVLLEKELEAIVSAGGIPTQTFRLSYVAGTPGALRAAVEKLTAEVEAAVRAGCEIVVLSDREAEVRRRCSLLSVQVLCLACCAGTARAVGREAAFYLSRGFRLACFGFKVQHR